MGDNKDIIRITAAHHEVHEGDSYNYVLTETTMQTTETINVAFKTPAAATKYIHMIVEFSTRAGGNLEILEAATWTAQTGTAATPMNANRNSSNTSSLLGNETTTVFTAGEIAYDVTTILTTNATIIEDVYAFGANRVPATNRGITEFILKAATTYVIRFTADGNTNGGQIHLRWYEHLPNVI